MAWQINFTEKSEKQFAKIDKLWQKKIVDYLKTKVRNNPLSFGESLTSDLKGLWRYRVGDYRIICDIKNKELIVLIVDVGHRKNIYDK